MAKPQRLSPSQRESAISPRLRADDEPRRRGPQWLPKVPGASPHRWARSRLHVSRISPQGPLQLPSGHRPTVPTTPLLLDTGEVLGPRSLLESPALVPKSIDANVIRIGTVGRVARRHLARPPYPTRMAGRRRYSSAWSGRTRSHGVSRPCRPNEPRCRRHREQTSRTSMGKCEELLDGWQTVAAQGSTNVLFLPPRVQHPLTVHESRKRARTPGLGPA